MVLQPWQSWQLKILKCFTRTWAYFWLTPSYVLAVNKCHVTDIGQTIRCERCWTWYDAYFVIIKPYNSLDFFDRPRVSQFMKWCGPSWWTQRRPHSYAPLRWVSNASETRMGDMHSWLSQQLTTISTSVNHVTPWGWGTFWTNLVMA